ncbi:MAG: cellulase family glycosylhydrolase [Candidatus Marinimicrobia bacterium]|nr:cellulase family glycosylhydrolase [Candidatus Neomarinimicrobiota bacterium]
MKFRIPVLLIALIMGGSCADNHSQNGFITVKGKQFFKDGTPYYFLGTNVWYGANLGALTEGGNRERLVRELDFLVFLGIKNLRVLGASEGIGQNNTVNPPIQPEPGKIDETILQGLDFLLAKMAQRDMTAVIYLNNFWVWSGGMSQYMSWLEKVPVPNPFLEEYNWHDFMNFSAEFYNHEEANRIFREYVKNLVNRKNTVSGILYKDDPTIMAWQLANEPRPGSGAEARKNFDVFARWIDETAGYIKSLDANHLVSTGNEGLAGSLQSDSLYLQIHRFENIDYMTFHLWVLNWSWYNPLKAVETFPSALQKAGNYIDQHIEFAHHVNKPIVLSEFGIPRDNHSYSPESATIYRDLYYDFVFEKIYANARNSGAFAGSNFWTWGGEGRPQDPENAQWKFGDPFTGDPPQEPQGRNSVFDADSNTLKIMKKYALLMNDLSK